MGLTNEIGKMELILVIRKGKHHILQTLDISLQLLEIMKFRKYAWIKLYPYPEILEIKDKSSESFNITPFCIHFKVKSKTPLYVFICALKSTRS